MKIAYINEGVCAVRLEDIDDSEPCNLSSVIERALRIKTAEDLINFLEFVPYPFLKPYFCRWGPDEWIGDLVHEKDDDRIRGEVFTALDRSNSEAEYLDRFTIETGALGEFFIKTVESQDGTMREFEEVHLDPSLVFMYLETPLDLAMNLQALARLAAVALGFGSDGIFDVSDLESPLGLRLVRSGLSLAGEHDRKSDPLKMLFGEIDRRLVAEAIVKSGCEGQGKKAKRRDFRYDEPFVVPKSMSDQEWAAFIFTWFMNSLFEGDADSFWVGNTFKVDFTEEGFKVMKAFSPTRDFYHEIAKLAESGSFSVCPICGHPVLVKKNQGTKAVYCSNSCKSRASNARKMKAYSLASVGVPMEEAIAIIGSRYASSIERWYREASNAS